MYKRKRYSYGYTPYKRVYKKKYTPKKRIVIPRRLKGYVQTSGFYGRYRGMTPEKKYLDTSFSGAYDSTGELAGAGLNLIPQGTTGTTRVGLKVNITSIHINGYAYSSTTSGSDYVRMMLVLDKQCNGAYPAFSDIVQGGVLTAFNNLSNSKRFVVMKDWKILLNTSGIATNFDSNTRAYASTFYKIKYDKICNIPVFFDSTAGAITEIKSNNLIIIAQSLGDDLSGFTFTCRIRFVDC